MQKINPSEIIIQKYRINKLQTTQISKIQRTLVPKKIKINLTKSLWGLHFSFHVNFCSLHVNQI